MKEFHILIPKYIDVTVKDLDITTIALIDTGSEVAFFQDFYYENGKNSHLIEKLKLKVSTLSLLI